MPTVLQVLPVFPSLPGIAYPVKRAPRWSGTQQDALSGKRVRTSYMTYPVYDYEVTFNFLRTTVNFQEWQQLAGFINEMAGSTGMFLYDDPNDDTVGTQDFGQGDGASTAFQLVRTLGGFTEPVFFPNVISAVAVGGTPTVAYAVSNTGQIVFTTAPAGGALLTWAGTFYWGCRFDMDSFDFSNFMNQLFDLKSLKWSSEKLP